MPRWNVVLELVPASSARARARRRDGNGDGVAAACARRPRRDEAVETSVNGSGHDRNLRALSITWPAARVASAMIVSIGLTPIGVGNSEASATIRRSTSCTRPNAIGHRRRCDRCPSRAVPIMWTVTTSHAARRDRAGRAGGARRRRTASSAAPWNGSRIRLAPAANSSSDSSDDARAAGSSASASVELVERLRPAVDRADAAGRRVLAQHARRAPCGCTGPSARRAARRDAGTTSRGCSAAC